MTALTPENERWRLRVLALVMLAGFGLLAVVLWRMQVGHGARYESSQEQQSVRRVRIPGPRGRLFDRQGQCLADNLPRYGIVIYLEELRAGGRRRRTVNEAWDLVGRLADTLGLPPQISKKDVEDHWYRRKPLPLLAWRQVDERVLARWAESAAAWSCVDVVVQQDRTYPQGSSAGHLLGYVASVEVPPEEEEAAYHYYLPDLIGKSGLEKRFDERLAGRAGGRLVRVDVSGFKHDETAWREPRAGEDLLLSIDLRAQRLAEQALGDEPGALVVVDPRNGDVLALASAPGFDPNAFSPSISHADWARLDGDPRKPLFNRAVGGLYPPGSTFKPLVALAALEYGHASGATAFDCPGYFLLGRHRFACYHGTAHGAGIQVRQALEVSCNVFFYQLGLLAGVDDIGRVAAAAGLGRKTGVEMDDESAGLLPDRAWKRARWNDAWRDGDTCNLAIGQSALQVTPLQMAMATAALANGGYLYQPRLVLGRRAEGERAFRMTLPVLTRHLHWSPEALALVQAGMRAVVQEPTGSGHQARVPGWVMAGKTGTAEYGRKEENRKHGWMILFAPFDHPRYAVAMVLDDAISGGVSVAPRLHALMNGLLAEGGAS